jgi:predicted homoserine dehydrogenase-like protein
MRCPDCIPEIEIVIEATGDPAADTRALGCCAHGKHVVMVNVEADALAGPLLARRAREAGIVYSLAYGDQPALICEMVDWCRAAGFDVVAAGKGTKYMPEYHESTPDTVWPYYGFTPAQVAAGDFNARMFNSFLDGTKSAIEMAAVANATGLTPAPDGLEFPPCGVDDLPRVLRPRAEGGRLHHAGQVE